MEFDQLKDDINNIHKTLIRIETSGRLFSKIAGLGFLGAFGKIITDIFKGA